MTSSDPSPTDHPVLLCRVGRRMVGLPAGDITGIEALPPLWRPPTLPPPLAGFLRAGDQAVPVLSLAVLLGEEAPAAFDLYAHVVTTTAGRLLVDRAMDFTRIADDGLSPVGADLSIHGCIMAEAAIDEGLVHLLDLDRLLDAAERQRLDALVRATQERRDLWGAG